jgi:hypothetical protein
MDPECVVFAVDTRKDGMICDGGRSPPDTGDEKSGLEPEGTDSLEASVV